jgi:hypothetical protein
MLLRSVNNWAEIFDTDRLTGGCEVLTRDEPCTWLAPQDIKSWLIEQQIATAIRADAAPLRM